MWNFIARFLARPAVADWLIARAKRTPYFHLEGYMDRWWLFNPYPAKNGGRGKAFEWLPSVRIHHIKREDLGRDMHNHPWDCRTIILKGWYTELRHREGTFPSMHIRSPGDTATIGANTFHHISEVSTGGVWTLFITYKYRHVWGFKTHDGFVPWREYLGEKDAQ